MLRRILIILGALVALLPYLGLPRSWDNVLFTFAGLAIVVLLVLGKRSASSRETISSARESTESTTSPRAVTPSTPQTGRTESHRLPGTMHKVPEVHPNPKTEVRRIARVSPSRAPSSAPPPRHQPMHHPTPNDVVVPPAVRPSPPPLPTADVSSVSIPQAFEERKPTHIRRQKPKSAEDFLKGDSA